MAIFTITKAYQCSGGGHFHFTVNDGQRSRQIEIDAEEMRAPITDDQIVATFKVLLRARLAGMKPADALAKINAGLAVTLE